MSRAPIEFVLRFAQALHRYGAPAHRLEDAIAKVALHLGMHVEVFSVPTAIIISVGERTAMQTRVLRMDRPELDLRKLADVDALANDVARGKLSPDAGNEALAALDDVPPLYSTWLTLCMSIASTAAIAVFFGASLLEVGVAGGLGLVMALFSRFMHRASRTARLAELGGAALAAFLAALLAHVLPVRPSAVTLAAIIVMLPGLTLTTAMTELATRHVVCGTARLMYAVLILLELALGAAIGNRAGNALFTIAKVKVTVLPEWTMWAALIVSALGIAVSLQAPRRAILWIVGASVVGYAGARFGKVWLGPEIGVGVGAAAMGMIANAYARWKDRPGQTVLTPAVVALVPGGVGFRAMSSLVQGGNAPTGGQTLISVFVIAMAIVAGLLLANALVSPRRIL